MNSSSQHCLIKACMCTKTAPIKLLSCDSCHSSVTLPRGAMKQEDVLREWLKILMISLKHLQKRISMLKMFLKKPFP